MDEVSPLNGGCHENQFTLGQGVFYCCHCCFLPELIQTLNLSCSLCTASCNFLALTDGSF